VKRQARNKRLVVIAGTAVTVALAIGLLATTVFGVSLPGSGYGGYGYCEGYGGGYGGGCDDPAPVSKVNPANGAFTLRGGANTGGVAGKNGSIPFNNKITLDENPPDRGDQPPPPGDPPGFDIQTLANYFNVNVQNLGSPGNANEKGPFNPPLEITIDVPSFARSFPDSELIACFFAVGGGAPGWHPIPSLGVVSSTAPAPTLPNGATDGFYIKKFPDGRREIHILSTHLTVFSAFRQVKKPATNGGNPPAKPGSTSTPLAVSASVKKTITVKKNRFKVPCKVKGLGAFRCSVSATAKVAASAAKKKRKKKTVIAKGSAPLKNGAATVVVKLTKKGKRALRRSHGRLRVSLKIQGLGVSGVKAASITKSVVLKQAKAKKKHKH
jgi:hypothetical protein